MKDSHSVSILALLVLACLSSMSSGVILRSYNDINYLDVATLKEFNEKFLTHFDANEEVQTTNTNILLGVSTPEVRSM